MVQIFKRKVQGIDLGNGGDSLLVGLNSNYRTSFTYTNSNETLVVKVEKVTKPDLTREEVVDLTYTEVASRSFTPVDFPKVTDRAFFYVEFDVVNQQIVGPFNAYDLWATLKVTQENYIETSEAYTDLQKRYHSEQLIPLFELRYFDKASEGFSNSVIRILTMEGQTHEETGNTIINSDVEVFLDDDTTPPSKTVKAVYTFCPKITYEVYDEADNKLNVTINKEFTNRYNVTLPAGIYYIKCIFNKPVNGDIKNTYSLSRTVNAVLNKNRIVVGDGENTVKFDISGLASGEVAKLKLDLDMYMSYGQLVVNIQ